MRKTVPYFAFAAQKLSSLPTSRQDLLTAYLAPPRKGCSPLLRAGGTSLATLGGIPLQMRCIQRMTLRKLATTVTVLLFMIILSSVSPL